MNVYQASQERLRILFNEFNNIYVSFSGGKDSGVLLNLCIDFIRTNNLNRKIGVFHLDYEAQYGLTTKYIDEVLSKNRDIIEVYRCCVPVKAATCTSMHESYWRPWEESKKDIWVRPKPSECLTEKDFSFFNESMWDYDFQDEFSSWYHEKNGGGKTACLIGIRTQESLHRWSAIHSDRHYHNYNGLKWTKKMNENVFNAYPIYDWLTNDIWTANAKFNWDYNKIYDLYYQAGVGIEQQRVSSPFHSAAQNSLKLYKVIEPNTWGKLISRVNGVNMTGIYGGTTAMGWNSIKLPPGHTWESYMNFLLSTLPEEAKENYLRKLSTSKKFWKERGGVLSDETITKLKDRGIKFTVISETNYKTTKRPVRMEYIDDIDIQEAKEIPTYKRMCICILKNDHQCQYMGFSLNKNESAKIKEVTEKYKNIA